MSWIARNFRIAFALSLPVAAGFACGGASTAVEAEAGQGGHAGSTPALGGTLAGGKSSQGSSGAGPLGGAPAGTGGGTAANTFVGTGGCLNGNTQCTNCEDDDGDGLIDALDPECSGPLDNDEGTFATGIPGDNIDFCQDCFFDGNSGHDGGEDGSDDGCAYHTECLYGRDPGGPADCFNCSVSTQCVDSCRPYTPNGCDCFGCCDVQAASGEVHTVRLSETCTLGMVEDEGACERCVKSADCRNDCERCELCIGKTSIPDDCYADGAGGSGGGSGQVCSEGYQVCNSETPCPEGLFCLTGCCLPEVVR